MRLKQQLRGMDALQRFWRWWLSELNQFFPGGLAGYFSGHSGTLAIYLEQGVARFHLSTGKQQRLLGVVDLEAGAGGALTELRRDVLGDVPEDSLVELYLPGEKVLVNRLFLPLATEANIVNVLKFEIDRLTPFRADQVSYGYRITGRYVEQGKIRLELYILRRDYLEPLLSTLQAVGLVPHRIWPPLMQGESATPTLNLLPLEQRQSVESVWNGRARQFGVAVLVLLLTVLVYPVYQLNRDIASVEQQLTDIRQPATVAGEKQSLLASRLAAQDQVVHRKNQSPGKLTIIHEMTRLLPDNTWISQMKVDNQTVTVQGESSKASDLIELLEKSAYFQNAVFVSPVTRNPSTNLEHYEIRMKQGEAPDEPHE